MVFRRGFEGTREVDDEPEFLLRLRETKRRILYDERSERKGATDRVAISRLRFQSCHFY